MRCKYTFIQHILLYDTFVKNKSYKSRKRRFCCEYLGVQIPASPGIFKLVIRLCSSVSLFDKKCVRQNAAFTKEKFRARLEQSPCKSPVRLAQQAQVLAQ